MDTLLDKLLSQQGFIAVVAVALGYALWQVLGWGKSLFEQFMKQLEAHRMALEAHTESAKLFHQEVVQAHDYMKESLDKILAKVVGN